MNWQQAYSHPRRPASLVLVSGNDIREFRRAQPSVSKPSPGRVPSACRPAPRLRASVQVKPVLISIGTDLVSAASHVLRSAAGLAASFPRTAAALLAAVSVCMLLSVSAMTAPHSVSVGTAEGEAGQAGLVAASPADEGEVPYVKSPDAARLQFAQSGEPWSDLPYWGDNVSLNGCGLCSYTSVVDILTGADYTPIDMLDIRGDWEGMDNYAEDSTGLDGMTHGEFTLATFGIESHRIDVSLDSLAATAGRGDSVAIVCAGGDSFLGTMGDEHFYPGHFVCVWDFDGENFHVHDSATSHGYGCDVLYTPSEMQGLLDGTTSIMAYRKLV